MADSSRIRTVLRLLAVVAALSVLAWMVALGGLWQVLSPMPEAPDLADRSLPTRTSAPLPLTDATPHPDGPFVVSGTVMRSDGTPVVDHPLVWSAPSGDDEAELGRTDAQGAFQIEVPEVGSLGPKLDTAPPSIYVTEDRANVAFVGLPQCPLAVTVQDPNGQPIPDQSVRAKVQLPGSDAQPYVKVSTGADGIAHLTDLPCGIVTAWVRRKGYPQGRRRNIDNLVDQAITIRLVDGVAVTGQVTTEEGEPIEEARVAAGDASDRTDADGIYGLLVDPSDLSRVQVSADGFQSATERLRVAAGNTEDNALVLDFVLQSARMVTVYCAGMPDDSCASVLPVMCTPTWLPVGEFCRGTPTECDCPDGAAAVRGGGVSVEVEPDDTEVWLDLRGRGSIYGRVTVGGQPFNPSMGRCQVIANRLPTALEDIPGGLSAGAVGSCAEDGSYVLHGLKAGNYLVMVETVAGSGNHPSIRVDGEEVDAGTLDIGGGGRIEGVVLDGTTGDGIPGQAVVAYAGTEDALNGLGQTTSGAEGHFEITGLQDGRYDVILAGRPFHTVSVTVEDGSAEPIELETGEAGLLTTNGFELETDDAGQLVVADVDPDGAAAAAGLEPGDQVVGVTIGGMDLGEMMPGLSDEITDNVLDHWGGPGVGLIVDRDGERVNVALD